MHQEPRAGRMPRSETLTAFMRFLSSRQFWLWSMVCSLLNAGLGLKAQLPGLAIMQMVVFVVSCFWFYVSEWM